MRHARNATAIYFVDAYSPAYVVRKALSADAARRDLSHHAAERRGHFAGYMALYPAVEVHCQHQKHCFHHRPAVFFPVSVSRFASISRAS